MNRLHAFSAAFCVLMLASCDTHLPYEPGADSHGHTAPTRTTIETNRAVLDELDLFDRQDFEDARRGLIASDPELKIVAENGSQVWNLSAYEFMQVEAPGSANPSLWRQEQLNNIHGLFEIASGVYQLRGFDLSNMMIIVGETGWILVDPLTARETASTAIEFAREHLPIRPIVALIYTHSHIDHFGGVLGVVSPEEAASGRIRIIAPKHFMEEATSENIIAGPAMVRRATYMYGRGLSRSERGHIGSGLGKSPAFGRFGILEPTEIVDRTPQELEIDGVRFVFQHVPGSEAPAALTFYLPDRGVINGGDMLVRGLHNIYTLRGTKVRDALRWSNYIDEAIRLFPDAEVYTAGHNWPVWGRERVAEYLSQQRDLYKYIHDQSVRLFNEGLTPGEIAEQLELPERLKRAAYNRDYYGTVRHNARAVYQHYLGWYDGNPARLNPHTPAEAGRRYVELAGGADALMTRARDAFEAADYRWAAELLNHLVFAQPGNTEAKRLLAATYDQLGYQAESAPWRDEYLSAARELRHGPPEQGINPAVMVDIISRTPVRRFFDSMAVRLNGPDAEGVDLSVNVVFSDLGESYLLDIGNSVLHHHPSSPDAEANATLNLTHAMFIRMLTGEAGAKDLLLSEEVDLQGSMVDLLKFFSLFDKPQGRFDIVTP